MSLGGAAALAAFQWRGNSAYDVNPSLLSTSTPGFAEWAAMYYNYRVMGGNLKVTMMNGHATNPVYFGIYFSNSATAVSVWSSAIAMKGQNWSRQVLLSPNNGDSKCMQTLKVYCPFTSLVGEKGMYKNDDNYQAFTTGNPSTLMYMYVYLASFDGASNVAAISPMKMEYTMYVDFFAKKPLFG